MSHYFTCAIIEGDCKHSFNEHAKQSKHKQTMEIRLKMVLVQLPFYSFNVVFGVSLVLPFLLCRLAWQGFEQMHGVRLVNVNSSSICMYIYIYTHKSCLLGQQQMNNSLTLMDIEELVFVLQSLHKPFWEKHGGLSLFTWK
jgi:hypothetical protein